MDDPPLMAEISSLFSRTKQIVDEKVRRQKCVCPKRWEGEIQFGNNDRELCDTDMTTEHRVRLCLMCSLRDASPSSHINIVRKILLDLLALNDSLPNMVSAFVGHGGHICASR